MARKSNGLGALIVSRITKPGLHTVGGVAGLALQVSAGGGRSWLLRYSVGEKRRELGLGGFPSVTLAGARDAAREARAKVQAGIDPIEHKRALRSALKAAQGKAMTFKACAESYLASKEIEFSNAKHRAQWPATLERYAYPVIGPLIVNDVNIAHILKILEPIWCSKTQTAKRVRGRIERVLDWATGRELRRGDNPARWRGLLQSQLPAPNKIEATKTKHHPFVAVNEMGQFMLTLRSCAGTGARALELVALTASRSGEVRFATHGEIDIQNAVWEIPAKRTKTKELKRVPLSAPAIALLKALPVGKMNDLLFPSPRGVALSDMTLAAVMRRMGTRAVPHGLRATFKTWASERTIHSSELAEAALGHRVGSKIAQTYHHGDLFVKRVALMRDWAEFCSVCEAPIH